MNVLVEELLLWDELSGLSMLVVWFVLEHWERKLHCLLSCIGDKLSLVSCLLARKDGRLDCFNKSL